MLWWLMFAVLVAVPLAMRTAQRQRRALPESTRPALASANLGLAERLGGVDAAIDGARSVLDVASPTTAQECAAVALRRHQRSRPAGPALGPGTARFEELLAALAAISPEDRRDLADIGVDPEKIIVALRRPASPDNWRQDVLEALNYWQHSTSNLRARRYG